MTNDYDPNATCGYVAIYNNKRMEITAKTSYEAQRIAAEKFKARKTWEVHVYLVERSDGTPVVHDTASL